MMPTYSYYCHEGHETTWFGRYSKRPEYVQCCTCDGEASPGVAKLDEQRPHTSNPEWQEKLKDYSGLSLHDFKCEQCGKVTEEIVDHGLNESASDGLTCECGGHAHWLPSCKIDRFSEKFPYFDRGLGVVVQSKQHRLQVCKEKGLTPVDGDWDEDKYIAKQEKEDDKLTRDYQDYCDKLDHHPAFKNYRKARDQGRL